MNNNYLKIKLTLPIAREPLERDTYFQILSLFLWNNEISGIETRDDETFMEWEEGNLPQNNNIEVIIYFENVIDTENFLFLLKNELKNIIKDSNQLNESIQSINYEINKNEDWKNEWKRFFKPMKISKHIIVKPEWEKYTPTNELEQVIDINPDMAFGTGLHETTKLIVQTVEKVFLENNYNLSTMLDVGAGTGILGIAAAKLKKDIKIDLVEIDLDSRAIAKENIKKNNSDNVTMLEVLIEDIDKSYDIVVSNIISSVLYQIKSDLIKKTKNILILSGVQAIEKEEFIEKFASNELKLIESFQLNDWVGFLYIKE
jgi:ribosomal protein L11 methyltransferase